MTSWRSWGDGGLGLLGFGSDLGEGGVMLLRALGEGPIQLGLGVGAGFGDGGLALFGGAGFQVLHLGRVVCFGFAAGVGDAVGDFLAQLGDGGLGLFGFGSDLGEGGVMLLRALGEGPIQLGLGVGAGFGDGGLALFGGAGLQVLHLGRMVRFGFAACVGDFLAQLGDGGLGLLGFGSDLGELRVEAAHILVGFRR